MELMQETVIVPDVAADEIEMARSENVMEVPISQLDVMEVRDVVYKQVFCGYFNDCLHLDLLLPQTDAKVPLVIDVPGGGFYESRSRSTAPVSNPSVHPCGIFPFPESHRRLSPPAYTASIRNCPATESSSPTARAQSPHSGS